MTYTEDLERQRKIVRSCEVLLELLVDSLYSAVLRINIGRILGRESYLEKDFAGLVHKTLRLVAEERMRLELMLDDKNTMCFLEQFGETTKGTEHGEND